MIQKILMRLKHLSLLCLVFVIYNVSIGTSKVVLASNKMFVLAPEEDKTPVISNNNNTGQPVSGNVNYKYNKENGQTIGGNNYPPFKEQMTNPYINFVNGKSQQGNDSDGPQNFPPAPSVVWFKKYIFDFNAAVDSVKDDYCAPEPANGNKKIKSKITLISLFKRNWLFIFLIPIFFSGSLGYNNTWIPLIKDWNLYVYKTHELWLAYGINYNIVSQLRIPYVNYHIDLDLHLFGINLFLVVYHPRALFALLGALNILRIPEKCMLEGAQILLNCFQILDFEIALCEYYSISLNVVPMILNIILLNSIKKRVIELSNKSVLYADKLSLLDKFNEDEYQLKGKNDKI